MTAHLSSAASMATLSSSAVIREAVSGNCGHRLALLRARAVSNIGVAPRHRGKGIGRQIMLFALRTMKEEGLEEAGLRVHVDNKPAIHLYKTLGFGVKERNSALIWRK